MYQTKKLEIRFSILYDIHMRLKYYSLLLVLSQFTLIFLLFMQIRFPIEGFTLLSIGAGILVGIWSVVTMQKSKLNILPDVRSGSTLITSGPYRYIRHPMYSSVLLFGIGVVIQDVSFVRLGLFLLLFIVLLLKIHYEESLLQTEFPEYTEYKNATKRLLPGVF